MRPRRLTQSYTLRKLARQWRWWMGYYRTLPPKLLACTPVTRTADKRLPNLLIVGLPKSATWWLALALEAHPDVFLGRNPGPERSEIRYFTLDFDKPLDRYARIFERSHHRIRVDKSPDYCFLPSSRIRFARRLLKSPRAILLLRDPVERAWSNAKMDLSRKPGRPLEEVSEAELLHHYEVGARLFDYDQIVRRWGTGLGWENLHIIDHDDVARDPAGVLRDVCSFLEIPYAPLEASRASWAEAVNTTVASPLLHDHRAILEQLHAHNIVAYSYWKARSKAGMSLSEPRS